MDFIAGTAILLLACIGNAELWVVLINRRHSLRYRHHQLLRVRKLHDYGLLLFPPFIFVMAGLGENGLLQGGTISDLPRSIQWILLLTFLGLFPFVYSVIRWNLRTHPKRLVSVDGQTFDVAALADSQQQKDAVLGSQTLLARMPFNQVYQLEVNTKKIQLRPGTKAGGTLRIAHFTDTHLLPCPGPGFHKHFVDRLCEMKPDFYAFTGDLLDTIDLLPDAVEIFRRLHDVAPGYFILGNHDWHLDFERIRKEIAATGWVDVAEKHVHVDHNGQRVMIAGTEAPWMGGNPDVPEAAGEALRLLLSHAPDQRNYAESNGFNFMLSGHNHGGQVVLPLLGPVYSPSRFGVQYSGGLFEYRDLLIHVSRGTGAKDPLRWNCRPEVSLLEVSLGERS